MKTEVLSDKTRKPKTIRMPVINPHAAGIDIGSREFFVCAAQDNVEQFGTTTGEINRLVSYLAGCQVTTVALESTGFYWQTLYIALVKADLEVYLVNARHVKNVKGHKTDVVDSRWLQLLHSIGLLSDSFHPDAYTEQLRTLVRHRRSLIRDKSRCVTKMNKSLVLMNIRLSNVMSDIDGVTGLEIIKAIIAGERNSRQLAKLSQHRLKASVGELEEALDGIWREDLLFELEQSYLGYGFYQDQIKTTDREIEKRLIQAFPNAPIDEKTTKGKDKNDPPFNLQAYGKSMYHVDLLAITGLGYGFMLTLISEVGLELISKFSTAKKFVNWLCLAPNTKKSGGKVISSHTPKNPHPLAKALRDAANSAGNSKTRLGDCFRSIAYRRGRAVAITAIARKMGVILWTMVNKWEEFLYQYSEQEQLRVKNKVLNKIKKQIKSLNITQEELIALS